jgi:hypothetical protein
MEEIKKSGRLDQKVKRSRYNIDHGVSDLIIIIIYVLDFICLAWSVGFLTTDTLLILHAGCLTFHAVNHNKQMNNGTKTRNVITNTEKV